MSWGYGFRPYVPVARRRAKAAKETAKMAKSGRTVSPIKLSGRKIASTFWGKAWCDNLEAYSDYANRLPRGRTYVRNGSVVDLQIDNGKITALVSGSELYRIEIRIQSLPDTHWSRVQRECTGKIDSLIEMLQGRLSSGVMQTVTRKDGGLFPRPAEIRMTCSCPDSAGLCKHLAATLYGVGARLDEAPELLFRLRGVDPAELISKASATDAIQQTTAAGSGPGLSDSDLADVFGIELETSMAALPKPQSPSPKRRPATANVAKPKVIPKGRRPKTKPPAKRIAAKPD
jgi:uncharacterized Zn finger protein